MSEKALTSAQRWVVERFPAVTVSRITDTAWGHNGRGAVQIRMPTMRKLIVLGIYGKADEGQYDTRYVLTEVGKQLSRLANPPR